MDELSGAALEELVVVFDGHPGPGEIEHGSAKGVPVSFAGSGRNAADRLIGDLVAKLAEPSACTVVTSDADLADRVRRAGAAVVGVGAFRRLLDGDAGP